DARGQRRGIRVADESAHVLPGVDERPDRRSARVAGGAGDEDHGSPTATAASRRSGLVTSSDSGWAPSGRPAKPSLVRAPAATKSPRARAASLIARPKPLDAPVISQTRVSTSFVKPVWKLASARSATNRISTVQRSAKPIGR